MTKQTLKQKVAQAVLDYIPEDVTLGVGSGSTIQCLIALLPTIKHKIQATVASSIATKTSLEQHGFTVLELPQCDEVNLYIDSADAYNNNKQLIKGGGGALTREKILAAANKKFICIADQTKHATILGKYPVAIEVIPMARSFVAHEIIKLAGTPVLRQNFTTDNGNVILDVAGWEITQALKLEQQLNNIPGVVANGIFAANAADLLLIATDNDLLVID